MFSFLYGILEATMIASTKVVGGCWWLEKCLVLSSMCRGSPISIYIYMIYVYIYYYILTVYSFLDSYIIFIFRFI